jgi:hypothetical protein
MPTFTMDIGVVLERRKARSAWIDVIWEAHAILPEPAAAERGASLGRTADGELFYAGAATLEAHTIDTVYYRDNLATGDAKVWIVLRPQAGDALPELVQATCDPTEGEGYTETGWDIVNALPMPDAIREALAAFVAAHHVEQPFIKRKRDRQDPEALAAGRRGPDRDRYLREMNARNGDRDQT